VLFRSLQDNHYQYYGRRSESHEPKVQATKFFPLSERIVIDNERCVACSRCVRFVGEVSKSHSLGIQNRGDHSLVRASEDGAFARDPYSDNVVDICPVGALLSKQFLYKSRVWYLKPTPSVCPGCERGCNIDLWHRKPEWMLKALDAKQNVSIERVTPRENWKINGPWICNKARDLVRILERPRAEQAMLKGQPASLSAAAAAAHKLLDAARKPVALISSWASNEQLDAFKAALGARFTCFVKNDQSPRPDEIVEDTVLIKPDKNPNGKRARELFGGAPVVVPADADLVLVWGEGCDFASLPRGAKIIFLNSWLAPENGHADVFIPISVQTERDGHYTNFEGQVSGFKACFAARPGIAHAGQVFAWLAKTEEVAA
jgi:NADH-quinone oxidoreductase subunit G